MHDTGADMARVLLVYLCVLVSSAVFSQQTPLCTYHRRQEENATRQITDGTIRDEGVLFITWNKACGPGNLRFSHSDGDGVTQLTFLQSFSSRSCNEVGVLNSDTQAFVGVVQTCPARRVLEDFVGRKLELWPLWNDSFIFEVFVRRVVVTPVSSMVHFDRNRRPNIFNLLAGGSPNILSFSTDAPYFPTIWIISTSSNSGNNIVSLTVLQADDNDCRETVVRVYDGLYSRDVNLLGSFCDTKSFFLSSSTILTVVLQTNLTERRGRFLLSYAEVPQNLASKQCNTTVNVQGPSLNLTSPGFPNAYPDSLDCWWLLKGPVGSTIVVQSESFLLQPSGSAPCTDWLRIYNNANHSASPLDTVCGSRNFTYVSTQGSMLLWFHSQDNFTARGFKLVVKAQDPDGRAYCDPDQGREVVLEQGQYGIALKPTVCSILLKATGHFVRLWASAIKFNDGSSFPCRDIIIYDGPAKTSPELSHWCGDMALNVRSTGKFIYVEYRQLDASVLLYASSEYGPVASQTSSGDAVLVAVGLCGVLFVVICILCCVGCCRVRSRRAVRRRRSALARPNTAFSRQPGGRRATPDQRRRPSLSQRIATVSERVVQRFAGSPPPYEAAVCAPPPPYSACVENRVPQELPPVDEGEKPPAYSAVGIYMES